MSELAKPFFYCLLASIIWAPIVLFAFSRIGNGAARNISDKLWPTALVFTALPAFLAPLAAAFGLSFRSVPPAPPMSGTPASGDMAPAAVTLQPAAPPAISVSEMFDAVALIYFYGVLLFAVLSVFRWAWFSYRTRFADDLEHPELLSRLETWRSRIGLRVTPRYALSANVSSVCVHGIFRPVILFPEDLLDRLPVEDAALMAAHEFAHIKRGDTRLFAFCAVIKAVFWFNPFIQRMIAHANLAAEQAADAAVIANGASRKRYAQCFVQGLRFAAGHNAEPNFAPALSFTPFDKKSRRARLDAILTKATADEIISMSGKVSIALSMAAAFALALTQAALAIPPTAPKDALPQAPVEGEVSMAFGVKSGKLNGDSPTHSGVDIKAAHGTAIRAAGDGKVIDATGRYRGQSAWGKVIVIDHGHGLLTRYAHLDSFKVKKGDRVKAGDIIGAVGTTGKSTGPHLHFEVIRDGLPVDPAPIIAASPLPVPKPYSKHAEASAPDPEAPFKIAPSKKFSIAGDETHLQHKLAGQMSKLNEKLQNDFKNFDGFEVKFGELKLEGFENAEEIARAFEDMTFEFDGIDDFETFIGPMMSRVEDLSGITPEDYERIRKEQKKAACRRV